MQVCVWGCEVGTITKEQEDLALTKTMTSISSNAASTRVTCRLSSDFPHTATITSANAYAAHFGLARTSRVFQIWHLSQHDKVTSRSFPTDNVTYWRSGEWASASWLRSLCMYNAVMQWTINLQRRWVRGFEFEPSMANGMWRGWVIKDQLRLSACLLPHVRLTQPVANIWL